MARTARAAWRCGSDVADRRDRQLLLKSADLAARPLIRCARSECHAVRIDSSDRGSSKGHRNICTQLHEVTKGSQRAYPRRKPRSPRCSAHGRAVHDDSVSALDSVAVSRTFQANITNVLDAIAAVLLSANGKRGELAGASD
jgi:hypothetical protein